MAKQNVNFEIDDTRSYTLVAFDQVGNAVSVIQIADLFNQRPKEVKETWLMTALARFGLDLRTQLLK